MKVFVSNHQNLSSVSRVKFISTWHVPFSVWVFAHGISNGVHLLPTFPPFMGITFLCAHVDNLQIVTPLLGVLFFVLDAVSLDGPFARAFPFHNAAALVGSEYNDKLAAATE